MSLRDYIGPDNFRYDVNGGYGSGQRPKPDGETLFYQILDRVRKQGTKSEAA